VGPLLGHLLLLLLAQLCSLSRGVHHLEVLVRAVMAVIPAPAPVVPGDVPEPVLVRLADLRVDPVADHEAPVLAHVASRGPGILDAGLGLVGANDDPADVGKVAVADPVEPVGQVLEHVLVAEVVLGLQQEGIVRQEHSADLVVDLRAGHCEVEASRELEVGPDVLQVDVNDAAVFGRTR
jgi:hypothetical protein